MANPTVEESNVVLSSRLPTKFPNTVMVLSQIVSLLWEVRTVCPEAFCTSASAQPY